MAPTARETHGEAATERQLRLLRQLRRLEDLSRRLDAHVAGGGLGALPQEICARWRKAKRCGDTLLTGAEWTLPTESPVTPDPVRSWCDKLRHRCAQVAETQNKARVER